MCKDYNYENYIFTNFVNILINLLVGVKMEVCELVWHIFVVQS